MLRFVSHGTILPFLPDLPGTSHSFSNSPSSVPLGYGSRAESYASRPISPVAVAAAAGSHNVRGTPPKKINTDFIAEGGGSNNSGEASPHLSDLRNSPPALGSMVTAMTPQTPLIRFPPTTFLTTVYQEYFEISKWIIPEASSYKRFRLSSSILLAMIDCLIYLRHSADHGDAVIMNVSLYALFLIHRRGHLDVMPNVVLATDHFYDK